MIEFDKYFDSLFSNKFLENTESINEEIDFVKEQEVNDFVRDSFYIDEKIFSDLIDENFINQRRVKKLDSNYTRLIISLLKSEDIEYGRKSQAELLIEEQMQINSVATLNWINDIYISHFSDDETIVKGLLRLLSNFDEHIVCPTGQVIALASLSHKSIEVREQAIQAFENWPSQKTLKILKGVNFSEKWLQDYASQVVKDITETLCLS